MVYQNTSKDLASNTNKQKNLKKKTPQCRWGGINHTLNEDLHLPPVLSGVNR